MISVKELERWLSTIDPDGYVGIDEDGLRLYEVTRTDIRKESPYEMSDACIEVGGIPDEVFE